MVRGGFTQVGPLGYLVTWLRKANTIISCRMEWGLIIGVWVLCFVGWTTTYKE